MVEVRWKCVSIRREEGREGGEEAVDVSREGGVGSIVVRCFK